MRPIILASKSPRRKELLSLITENFVIKSAEVDENLPKGIQPDKAVEHLSKIKAEPFKSEEDVIIGADTVVSIDGVILGKPKDRSDAFKMLKMLSGKYHSVFTGVTIIKPDSTKTFSVETRVKFFDLTDREINDYLDTGEPFDKAGAYGIQGKGSLLVEKIDGDYFNVVGLPVSTLNKYLK
ncbi:MAG TPA: septum formation protein Maf [Ruminococcaceae bacterium]|nr:septum formation protein Maf [Oscillospiraceae bacterium]